jgi:ketose-bisphosphate aldolase
MTLTPIPILLSRALDGNYAVGYFESWNLESLQGTLDAVEETHSPVIIGFNGEFLSSPSRIAVERIHLYASLGRAAAESSSVPCGFIFNECSSESAVQHAIESGFNLVMWINQAHAGETPLAEDLFISRLTNLVERAHKHGVAVEAELGELPSGESGKVDTSSSYLTDPDVAVRLVKATGIDCLSVSIGNVHVLSTGTKDLDLVHLEQIRQKVTIPLGLHGGTGISPDSLRQGIKMGITKVNYGTGPKLRYLDALRRGISVETNNPHRLLGMGEKDDLLVSSRQAVKEAVLERLEVLGSIGKGR